ncbi:IS110 family RNA-guided transposase [Haloplanus aerogenes]|uniref:Transposase n=1 Tax=Haloplanus aerogenes TaxID=660522 RepID=A0A3M0DP21_9EURY|nr:IS110 family transposase [Haloplanus aerogenes]AZH24754.1 IS110 family transposase [Haloplanus aerogenes]RMB23582.1 transposase [Haloplanus aerogenes]
MYLGIDTHKRYSQVAVVDGDGNLQDEIRLPNDRLDELAEQYTGAEAAIEASGHYRPIYEMLDEHLDVTLVNPSKNRIIADAAVKTDRVDAKRLAQMLRAGMLAESYVPPDEIRVLRDLVRTRKSLVEARTAEKNRVRAVLTRTDNTYDSELFGPTGREFLAELSLSDVDRAILEAHLSIIDEYDQQIERLEEKVERRVLESPAAQRLLTIPGVGQYTAAVIAAEVGEIERFDEDKQLVSYAGLDPVIHQSGDKEIRGSISKEGSAPLRWALVQCANIAVRCDEYLGNFYTRLKQRKNHQIAIVATARKMLVSIFHMLTRKEPYDPPGVSA